MDLVTLVTACALAVDPKLMHALVWHQSGGEPWAIAVQGESNPRVYPSMAVAIRETRSDPSGGMVRVGLAGALVEASKVSASVLSPCRNVAMAAAQIQKHIARCEAHPRLKVDPIVCAVAVYRGSWDRPDIKFATAVAATVAKGDAPDFDMPRGTSTESFDTAGGAASDVEIPVVDLTAAFAEPANAWSSGLFPPKLSAATRESGSSKTASSPAAEPSSSRQSFGTPSARNPNARDLFVRRTPSEPVL